MSLSFAPEDRERWIKSLTTLIREGILSTTPHAGTPTGAGRIFTGNYDYHSCVHAHWALLAIARLEKDTKLELFLEDRLKAVELEAERLFLADPKNADFELPYGQAWKLLLLAELDQRVWGHTETTKRLREEIEDRLIAWLERTPFPDMNNEPPTRMDNPWQDFRGDHYSWVFPLLMLQLSKPDRKAVREKVRALKEAKVEPHREILMKNDFTDADFLHIPSLLALIDRTDDHPHAHEPRPPFKLEFRDVIHSQNAHSAGLQATRLWPVAWDCQRGKEGSCRQFWKGMSEFLSRPEQYKSDFRTVSHWVPQFLWMALWIEMGAL